MKPCPRFEWCVGTILALATCAATADTLFEVHSGPLALPVPDGSLEGLQGSLAVQAPFDQVGRVDISVRLAPGDEGSFLGDLYLTLRHDGRLAVLMNRPGRDADRRFGYNDSGTVSVTFDDGATLGDIHRYRSILQGDDWIPLPGDLTGFWQPDGRTSDPLSVLSGDPRSALLNQFAGTDPDGAWTLFLSDLSTGGTVELQEWSLRLSPSSAGPTPSLDDRGSTAGLVVLGASLVFWGRRRFGGLRRSAGPGPSGRLPAV